MRNRGIAKLFVAILVTIIAVTGLFVVQKTMKTEAAEGIYKTISFQGKMTDDQGLNVADGTYQFVFSIYTVASGGSSVWTETVNLDVADGIFQHNLGSSAPLPGSVDFNTDNIFLGITFNSDPDGEMSPRIQLTASPYAFNADQLDGLDATDFVQLSPSVAQAGDIDITGSITAGSVAVDNLILSDGSSNTATIEVDDLAGDYVYTVPTTSGNDTFCLENLNNCGGGGGSSLFTDAGAHTYLTSTADQLVIGSSSAMSAKFAIIGSANETQLLIRANNTQSNPLLLFENSSGTEIGRLHTDGTNNLFGTNAGVALTTGYANNAFGTQSLHATTDGFGNNAFGDNSLWSNTTGDYNTAMGSGALYTNTTGNSNVAIGGQALATVNDNENTAIGRNALTNLATGWGNIAIGFGAGDNVTSGNENIIIGSYLDAASSTGSNQLNIAGLLTSSDYTAGGAWNGDLEVTGDIFMDSSQALYFGTSSLDTYLHSGGLSFTWDAVITAIDTGDITINAGDLFLQSYDGGINLSPATNVTLGTSNTTGTLLVLDTKTSSGDPTGVNGGMYYNSNSSKFRCYEGGTWKDCIGSGGGSGDILNGGQNGPLTIGTNNGSNLNFETSGTTHMTIDSSGDTVFLGSLSVQGSSGSGSERFGIGSQSSGDSVAVGAYSNANGNDTTAVGYSSEASNFGGSAFGYDSTANGFWATAVGNQANAGGWNAVALGYQSSASGDNSVVVGSTSSDGGFENVIALGSGITATSNNELNIAGLIRSSDYSTGALSMSTSGAGAISIGTGSSTGTIGIGNTGSGTTTIRSGGNVELFGNGGSSGLTVGSVLVSTLSTFRFQSGGQITTPNSGSFSQSIALRTGSAGGSVGSGSITIQTGDAGGTTINSGGVTIDSGSATGTAGTISIGATNSSSVVLGRTGITTAVGGSLTVGSNATVSGSVLAGASGEVRLASDGQINQDITNASYDIWIQGSAFGTSAGDARNLALLGMSTTDRLALNYNSEYDCVTVGGTTCSEALSVSGDGSFSGYVSITSASTGSGNLRFSAANPYITASSYINMPGGLYVSGGTLYVQNGIDARGTITSSTGSVDINDTVTLGSTVTLGNGWLSIPDDQNAMMTSTGGIIMRLDNNNNGSHSFVVQNYAGTNLFVVSEFGNVDASATIEFGAFGTASGNHLCYSASNQLATCTSSRTLKHDITSSSYGLDQIRQLQSVSFAWNADNRRDIGFIAEEVARIIPETTQFNTDGSVFSFSYDPIVSVLTRAVQQLDVQIVNNTERLDVAESTLASVTGSTNGYATTESVQTLSASLLSRIESLENGNFVNLTIAESVSVGGNLSVAGAITTTRLNLAGKLVTSGAKPTGTVLGAGTVTLDGNDTAGEVSFNNTGTAPGQQLKIDFAQAFSSKPRINLTPVSAAAAGIRYFVEPSATGFTINFIDAPDPGVYTFNYFAVE